MEGKEKLNVPHFLPMICCNCGYPVTDPARQTTCGCRMCPECFSSLLERTDTELYYCKRCDQYSHINDLFKDRAVNNELERTSFPCFHHSCPWFGSNVEYKDHISTCSYAIITCPHIGCGQKLLRDEMSGHKEMCIHAPSICQFCNVSLPLSKLEDHFATDCPEYIIPCSLGCGTKIPRRILGEHLSDSCLLQERECRFTKYGCHRKDTLELLIKHYKDDAGYHVGLLEKSFSSLKHQDALKEDILDEAEDRVLKLQDALKEEILDEAQDRILKLIREGFASHVHKFEKSLETFCDGLLKAEMKLSELQDSYSELSFIFQAHQATSFNGQFVWKIPEVARRRQDSRTGKTGSLYSAPFHTSRFGYKLCLRLYLNGDGSGKNTHISFFLTVMRGEYDALLPWPFSQMVTLMLLDQSGSSNHIVQCFKPDPSSSSFWKPKSDVNVASGCPRFAPMGVFDDTRYLKDDAMFFKVIIDVATVAQP